MDPAVRHRHQHRRHRDRPRLRPPGTTPGRPGRLREQRKTRAARPGAADDHGQPTESAGWGGRAARPDLRGASPTTTTTDRRAASDTGRSPCPTAGGSPSPLSRCRRSTATTATNRTPTSPTTPCATSSRYATGNAPSRPAPATPGTPTSSTPRPTTRAAEPAVQRRITQPPVPPGQTVTRMERHPAPTRLASMDHPHRPDLHPRTQAIPGLGEPGQTPIPLGRAAEAVQGGRGAAGQGAALAG